MSHFVIALIGLIVILGAASSVLGPEKPSRRGGAENGWMNADFAEREARQKKAREDRRKARERAGKN